MNPLEKKADDLVLKHYQVYEHNIKKCILHAIKSTKNTIEVLERLETENYNDFQIYIEQKEILKILESRL